LNQEIKLIPDHGAATNGIASTAQWEPEGTTPLRCEDVETDPGKRQDFFDAVPGSESVAQTTRQLDVRSPSPTVWSYCRASLSYRFLCTVSCVEQGDLDRDWVGIEDQIFDF